MPPDKEKYNEMLQKCPLFKSDKKEEVEVFKNFILNQYFFLNIYYK